MEAGWSSLKLNQGIFSCTIDGTAGISLNKRLFHELLAPCTGLVYGQWCMTDET